MRVSPFLLGLIGLCVCAAGCAGGDDDDASPNGGAGSGGVNSCVGQCAGSGGSTSSAGSGGSSPASGGAGGGTSIGGGGTGGTSGVGGGTGGAPDDGPVIISMGSCPSIAEVMAAGKAAPGFATLYEATGNIDTPSNLQLNGDHVYFYAQGAIRRVLRTGGPVEVVREVPAITLLVIGTDLIWVDLDTDATFRIVKTPIAGNEDPVVLATGLDMLPTRLFAGDDAVYWIDPGPGVGKVAFAGGKVETLAPDSGGSSSGSYDVALLGDDIYMLNDASLLRVDPDGKSATMVAVLFHGGEIASDGTDLYWADGSEGTVKRWLPDTMEASLLATGSWPETLAAANGTAYWSEQFGCSQVFSVNADAGQKTLVMEGFRNIAEIVADASGVYVRDQNALYRMDR